MNIPATSSESAVGLLIGAAAGDALGWPQELRGGIVGGQKARDSIDPTDQFYGWVRNGGSRFTGVYRDPVGPGEYSDDTQLLLATGRACLSGARWLPRLFEVELPSWPAYQRGGGRAVLAAASSWAQGTAPWQETGNSRSAGQVSRYRNAGANGVAMRIAPHVLYARRTGESITERIMLDGLTTHGHPRALAGALIYGAALNSALDSGGGLEYGALISGALDGLISASVAMELMPTRWGDSSARKTFENQWAATVSEVSDLMEIVERSLERGALSQSESTLVELGCTDPKINGSGTVTAAGAIYLASRAAARPMSGLLAAANLRGGDTDTLASMTGALLGAIHGSRFLGELRHVQDVDYLVRMGNALVDPNVTWDLPAPPASPAQLRRHMIENLLGGSRDRGTFPDGRIWRLDATRGLSGSSRATRFQLALEDGQTVFIDVVDRQQKRRAVRQGEEQLEIPHAGERALQRQDSKEESTHGAKPVQAAMPRTSAIEIGSRNFLECVKFYEQLFGRALERGGEWVKLTPWLTLYATQSATQESRDPEIRLNLPVRDLAKAKSRVGGSADVSTEVGRVRVVDPDGRVIYLVEGAEG